MLLGCLVAGGAVFIVLGALLSLATHVLGAGIWLLVVGLVVVLGVAFERRRYKPDPGRRSRPRLGLDRGAVRR